MRRALLLSCIALTLAASAPARAADADVQTYMNYAREAATTRACELNNLNLKIQSEMRGADPMTALFCGDTQSYLADPFADLTQAFSDEDLSETEPFDLHLGENMQGFVDTNIPLSLFGVDISKIFGGSGACDALAGVHEIMKCFDINTDLGSSYTACNPCTAPGDPPNPLADVDLTTPEDVRWDAPCKDNPTPFKNAAGDTIYNCVSEGCYRTADGTCAREGEPAPYYPG
jgi:hypothetical protein